MKRTQKIATLLTLIIGISWTAMPTSAQLVRTHMRQARYELSIAVHHLDDAKDNKNGHKAKAKDWLQKAEKEVLDAEAYADSQKNSHSNALKLKSAFVTTNALIDQPSMEKAKDETEKAIKDLEKADPKYGGHRVKALEYAKEGLREINLGIEWARTH